MSVYKVVEIFESINGEGTKAGQLATFVRFKGCNLNCDYCDTKWANEADAPYREMTETEIFNRIKSAGIRNVTITGGEPLIQPDIKKLLELIAGDKSLYCEIETNGSVNLEMFADIPDRPSFTMDYKLGASGMEKAMCLENFKLLTKKDTVKFVSGSRKDLEKALEIIKRYNLTKKCSVYISPVFGKIEPCEIVNFMKEKKLNGVNLQIQMHKVIWNPEERGV